MKHDPVAQVAVVDDGVLKLSGRIGYPNADSGLTIGRKALANGAVTRINLAGLEAPDSATLAMLLVWAAEAKRSKHPLIMSDAPEGLRALARLANAEVLLGF